MIAAPVLDAQVLMQEQIGAGVCTVQLTARNVNNYLSNVACACSPSISH
jgi:hypothetical protein